ncbi:MAG: hypothetical protein ACTSYS_13940 [Promethearchaeota archaeon]
MIKIKIVRKKVEQIYAYKTKVSVTKSIEEIKRLLMKYNCLWVGDVQNPYTGEKFISFMIPSKIGDIPVKISVPEIWYKNKYLKRESYRALVLLIKSKLILVDLGEPMELVFLPNVSTKHMKDLLPESKSEDENLLLKPKDDDGWN